jgi:basic membrane protein A and related proteins
MIAAAPAAAEEPTSLRIAGVLSAGQESPWEASFVASMNRVIAAKPHGLTIEVDYTENVYDNAEDVYRAYAESGEYDIIFGDSTYVDAVEAVKDEFPEILFVYSGSGNRPLGGNGYWIFQHGHEPGYVLGQMAGALTQSGTIGIVSSFPADDINDQINAFVAGAKEINPEAKAKITFIQSWYDPAKANEAASAQIAAGADIIYQMSSAFEVCEQSGIGCFGNFIDVSAFAPNSMIASALLNWDPHINYVIDEWWAFKTTGEPMDAPMEKVWFTWAEGSGDIVRNPVWYDKISAEHRATIEATMAAILSGEKVVELDLTQPTSD